MKIALVTGASRGIGKAIALRLGRNGMTVIGTGTTDESAALISDYLGSENISGEGMPLDVRDADEINKLVAEITAKYAPVNVLVNNAGITKDNLLMRMKNDQWFDLLDVNLGSVYRLSKACLNGMIKQRWGRIISISSVVAAMGNAGQTNYAAAKAGIIGFSKSLAREAGSRGITVNAVAPGFIATDMTKNIPAKHIEALKRQITLGKLGQPEDVAAAVAFLASDEAAYITGQTIHVNGGMYM